MTGARGGVIGVKREQIIRRFLTQMPVRFETAEEDPWVMGVPGDVGRPGLRELDRADPGAVCASRRLRRSPAREPACGGLAQQNAISTSGNHHTM